MPIVSLCKIALAIQKIEDDLKSKELYKDKKTANLTRIKNYCSSYLNTIKNESENLELSSIVSILKKSELPSNFVDLVKTELKKNLIFFLNVS